MFDCRYCSASNFIDENERNDHESSCWEKKLIEADWEYDRELEDYQINIIPGAVEKLQDVINNATTPRNKW